MTEEISLRPIYLGPKGGPGGFSQFGKSNADSSKSQVKSFVPVSDYNSRPRTGERITYTSQQLLEHAEKHMRPPPGLLASGSELLLMKYVGEGAVAASDFARPREDEGRWRNRAADDNEADGVVGDPQDKVQGGAGRARAQADEGQTGAANLTKAEDRGGSAWRRGGVKTNEESQNVEQAIKLTKGILNKLTVDNFDKLSAQVYQVLTNPEIVRRFIPQVFEKAVAEPAFCNLYAQLCVQCEQVLKDSDLGVSANGKKVTFKRLLLETCQDQFDIIVAEKKKISGAAYEPDGDAHRKFKQRTLGTVRLIGELYNHSLIQHMILEISLQDLLHSSNSAEYTTNNDVAIEATCQLLSIAGKQLDADQKATFMTNYIKGLEQNVRNANLNNRLKFLIKDLLDQRSNAWKPRKETYTAKRIEDVRKEAYESLNMQAPKQGPLAPGHKAYIDTTTFSTMDPTSALIFPEFEEEQGMAGGQGAAQFVYGNRGAGKSQEELQRMVFNIIDEYLVNNNVTECIEEFYELGRPECGPFFISSILYKMFDVLDASKIPSIVQLIPECTLKNLVTDTQCLEGMRMVSDIIDDVRCDHPKAMDQIADSYATCLQEGVLQAKDFIPILSNINMDSSPDVLTRRDLFSAILSSMANSCGAAVVPQVIDDLASAGGNFEELLGDSSDKTLDSVDVYLEQIKAKYA